MQTVKTIRDWVLIAAMLGGTCAVLVGFSRGDEAADLLPAGLEAHSALAYPRDAAGRLEPSYVAGRPLPATNAESPTPWGAVVCGWALPPQTGQPRRFYDAMRIATTSAAPGHKVWAWYGPSDTARKSIDAAALASEMQLRPMWARVVDLSAPHPFTAIDGTAKRVTWFRGLSAEQFLTAELPAIAERVLAPLAQAPVSWVAIDDESVTFFEPWKAKREKLWDAIVADPALPAWLDEAALTRADFDRLAALPVDQARREPGYNRWLAVAQRHVSEALGRFGEALQGYWPTAQLVATNHSHRCPALCPSEPAGSWIAPAAGAGVTPDSVGAVKLFGKLDPAQPASDWNRVVSDVRRMQAHRLASRDALVAILQANHDAGTEAWRDPSWWLRPAAADLVVQAAALTGSPLLVSQVFRPSPGPSYDAWAEYIPRWQRAVEAALEEADQQLGGMGGWPVPPDAPAQQTDSRVVSRYYQPIGRVLVEVATTRDVEPPPATVETKPRVVRGTLTLDRDLTFATSALLVAGDAVIDLAGHTLRFGAAGQNESHGVWIGSNHDDTTHRLLVEAGELAPDAAWPIAGSGYRPASVTVRGPGSIEWASPDARAWACAAIGTRAEGPPDRPTVPVTLVGDVRIVAGGLDGSALALDRRPVTNTGGLVEVIYTGTTQRRDAAVPVCDLGAGSQLVGISVLGGQAPLRLRSESSLTRFFVSPDGEHIGAYAVQLLSTVNARVTDGVIAPRSGRGIIVEQDDAGPESRGNTIERVSILGHERIFDAESEAYGLRLRYGTESGTYRDLDVLSVGGPGLSKAHAVGLSTYPAMPGHENRIDGARFAALWLGASDERTRPAAALLVNSGNAAGAATLERPATEIITGTTLVTSGIGLSLDGYDAVGYWVGTQGNPLRVEWADERAELARWFDAAAARLEGIGLGGATEATGRLAEVRASCEALRTGAPAALPRIAVDWGGRRGAGPLVETEVILDASQDGEVSQGGGS